MNNSSKLNLLDFDRQSLRDYFVALGEKNYRADQLIKWVHQLGVTDFNQMTNVSKQLRAQLAELTEIRLPEIAYESAAQDGTQKWLLRMADGNIIETVFIPEKTRGTLCISSQIGCTLNCSFCSTGKQGFNRNLSTAEIIGQVWIAVRRLAQMKSTDERLVTNVVLMGMGEPLMNYAAVLKAINLMLDDNAYGLSKYRVTLSTAGVIPEMLRLRADSEVSLAVSLHAPTNELRNVLVPLNRKYPLEQLMPLCRDYFPRQSKRVVTFEYVMLNKINDTPEHAQQLIELLQDVPCKINLIPFNSFPLTQYQRSTPQAILQFQNALQSAGHHVIVRRTRGDEITAACGQLVGDILDRTGRHHKWLRDHRSQEAA